MKTGGVFGQPGGEAGTTEGPVGERGGDDRFFRAKIDAVSGAGDAGVEQFPGEDRRLLIGQHQQNPVESRPLRLVDRHGEDALMFRQLDRMESVLPAGEADLDAAGMAGGVPDDADVAVAESGCRIVSEHDQRQSRCVIRSKSGEMPHEFVELFHSERPLAHRGEDAEGVEQLEGGCQRGISADVGELF